MPVEVAKLVDDFNKLWPRGTDPVSKADDHIRMIKEVLKLEFELLYNKTRVFSFEAGAVVNPDCILYYEAEKAFYQWNGTYDVNNEYVVNAGSTPETAGGIGGNAWTRSTGSGFMSTVLVSDTEPTAPFQNMLWWDTNSGIFFIYYNDGTSTQWVDLFGIADQASFNTLLFRSVLARLAAESGYTLVGGSFQEGAVSSGFSDVVLDWNTAKFYQWHLNENKEVPAGSTPATSGGIGAGAWVDRTDETLRTELSSPAGVSLVATNKFHVYIHSAPDDGITDATAFFTSAAAIAAVNNVDVIVKPPAVSYLLSSNPVVPKEVNILASPSWFSGAGELPIHSYQRLSEGVDPRDLELGYSVLMGTSAPQNGRKWAIQGAVDITIPPATTGTDVDSVGLSGRAYARADGARVWGLVCLGMLGPGVADTVTQCVTAEFDINNNKASAANLDDVVGSRGIFIVSGGMYRPQEAQIIFATKPDNVNGDNRFVVGTRYSGNSFLKAATWYDDEVATPATSIGPLSGHEFRYMGQAGFLGVNPSSGALNVKPIVGDGIHYLSSDATKSLFQISDNYIREVIPVHRVAHERGILGGAVLDTTLYDRFIITEAGTINGLSTGSTGQSISIANLSGGDVVLSRSSNMRTPSGAAVTIPPLAVANFEYLGGVWLLNYVGVQNQ